MIILLLTIIIFTHAVPEPIYNLHYIKSFRGDQVNKNFGCGKSIVYGTYLYPMGPLDGLYMLLNSYTYGFNGNCQRNRTFIKLFGHAQDYQEIIKDNNAADSINQQIARANIKDLIIDWSYLPEESSRVKARDTLQKLVEEFKKKGYKVYVKAPASYFCLDVGGKKYILDQPADFLIVKLYGEEPGKYTTYESIFGTAEISDNPGYTMTCPKYPTKDQLAQADSTKKIYFEKTMDSSETGYIGSNWVKFL